MASQNDTSRLTFNQSGGLAEHLRVKLSVPATRTVALAGANEASIGTVYAGVHGTDPVTVQLKSKPGTRKMVAAGAFAAGAVVYGAAGGKIDDVPNGNPEGWALEASTDEDDVVEVLSMPGVSSVLAMGNGRVLIAGEVTLDGSNPTPIATGLAGIESAVVAFKRTTTPGLDPTDLTVDYTGSSGTVNVYAWAPTASGNVTLIASTNNTAVVAYQIVALLVAAS